RQAHVVHEELELVVGADQVHLDPAGLEPGGVGGYHEQGRGQAPGPFVLDASDDEHRVGHVDPGDEGLAAVEDPSVTVAAGGGGEAVGVGTGVGLGDGKGHDGGGVRQARQPALPLLRGAEAGEHGTADGRGDHHHQGGAPGGAEFLQDRCQVSDAAAPAVVLLGDVDPQVAEFSGLAPQFGEVGTFFGLGSVVVGPVVGGEGGHGRAQFDAFGRFGEGHGVAHWSCPSWSSTASSAPAGTRCPASTGISRTAPAVGAVMRCSIFIASMRSSVWPLVTFAPTDTSTAMTVPGMGAGRAPGSTTVSGEGRGSTGPRVTGPRGDSTYTSGSSGYVCTVKVRRTPSTSSTTSSGVAGRTRVPSPSGR